MPFAGDSAAAGAALSALQRLTTRRGDELILADNAGTATGSTATQPHPGAATVRVVRAAGEPSPAHARNAGAAAATNDWILFIDADCEAPPDLIDAFFTEPIPHDVGALAGEVLPAAAGDSTAARDAASRSFLGQSAHLAHPFRPRAAAANLLVRRRAFEQIHGFYEGLRAAEDTDFCWRLQASGWRLGLRPHAAVRHRYRATLRELRRQWRGYAAGRAWLARRYDGFTPEPALTRAARRVLPQLIARPGAGTHHRRPPAGATAAAQAPDASAPAAVRSQPAHVRAQFFAIDALLAAEELAGLALSNRPAQRNRSGPAKAVLVAERFPAAGDPLVDLARSVEAVRVEAASRAEPFDPAAARELHIDYREDDGALARLRALIALGARHPLRIVADLFTAPRGNPTLLSLAPAARRLERDRDAVVQALGTDRSRATAKRLARLAGRPARIN
jgi:GT2 family glycosyltransferase